MSWPITRGFRGFDWRKSFDETARLRIVAERA